MFVPVPNAFGSALITIQALDNVITVDTILYQRLETALGSMGTDHTYIKVGQFPYVEYMRVTQVSNIPNQLIVQRGIDGTDPQVHAANTGIEYVLAYAAVQDAIADAEGVSITLNGTGAVQIDDKGNNVFDIHVQPIDIRSDNQSVIVVDSGSEFDPTFNLAVNPEMFGQCNPVSSGGGA